MKQNVAKNIITAAAPLIYRQGFHRTGLKEILDAAEVPKGSFYFYFKSKEDFGLALIDHYAQALSENVSLKGAAGDASALRRLRKAFETHRDIRASEGCEGGCPLGNLAQEMSDLSARMRERLQQALGSIGSGIASLLREAQSRVTFRKTSIRIRLPVHPGRLGGRAVAYEDRKKCGAAGPVPRFCFWQILT